MQKTDEYKTQYFERILAVFCYKGVISNVSLGDNTLDRGTELIRDVTNRSIENDLARRLRRLITALCLGIVIAVSPALGVAQNQQPNTEEQPTSVVQIEQTNWGQRNSFWMSPLAIILSALGSWYLVSKSISENRKISQRRATFDYYYKLSWDKDYIDANNRYLALTRGTVKLSKIASDYAIVKAKDEPESDEDKKIIQEYTSIRSILNEYESIAVGIATDTLSEEIILRNMRQTLAKAIDTCSGFIDETRKNSEFAEPDKIYCEVKKLVAKWRKDGDLPTNDT